MRPHDTPRGGDELFKHVFLQAADAASKLQAVLPSALVAAVDWTTFELVHDSFVDEHLRAQYADLLYQARVRGRATRVYFLVEHKRRQERFAAFQVLGYQMRIWERYRRSHPKARYLPPIYALVIHHGKQPWRGRPHFANLVDTRDKAVDAERSHVPELRFVLDDLATVSELELWKRSLTPGAWLTLLSFQRSRQRGDLCKELARWRRVDELVAEHGGRKTLEALVRYTWVFTISSPTTIHDSSSNYRSTLQPASTPSAATWPVRLLVADPSCRRAAHGTTYWRNARYPWSARTTHTLENQHDTGASAGRCPRG